MMDNEGYDINGKIALVTGAASGIGAAVSEALLTEGLKGIALCDFNEEQGLKLCNTLAKTFGSDKVRFIKCNVLQHNEIELAFEETIKTFGQLDIVFNNAGIFNETEVSRTININLTAVVIGTQFAIEKYLPKYKSSGEGIVLNTASVLGLTTVSFAAAYCAAKHGVVGLGKCYGTPEEYNRTKVRVMSLCPSFTVTPLLNNLVVKKEYQTMLDEALLKMFIQKVESVSATAIYMIKYGRTGSVWIVNKDKMEEVSIVEAIDANSCF